MKVVKNIKTNRLVYREEPDFKKGLGIKNAIIFDLGMPDELKEVTVTQAQWEAELALREQERPPTLQKKLDTLTLRVENIEKVILLQRALSSPP